MPQWGIAPYFLVADVVTTANFRLCFGHDIETK